MSDTVFGLHAKVSADVSPFNQAMDSSATSVSSSLSSIHDAARMFIGSGVVRTFIKATEAAYKFGQSMADISAISDLNIKSLSKSIMQLENVYGRASTVGETVYEIISSGIEGSEKELLNFAKVAGQAAVSIKADLYDTANVITTLTNAYGMSADEVGRIADMLFVTVREGKAHGNELAKTLGLVTNTAAEAGVTLEEMTAVISILSRTQSPSQSMIGFNQMLNGLIKPTQEAAREAEKWGIEIGATALQTKGLTAILTEMHEKIGGNVEAINKILGNIRAMRAGVSLTGRQFENFIGVLNQAKAEIGTGVAMEAFSKQTNTAKQSLENLKTQLDKTFIGVGKDFEPITRRMAGFTEELLKAFSASNGIGKWSVYAVALVTAIKGAVFGLKTLSDVHKHLTASTDKTNKASKQYADHMERAKNAATATVAATASIGKNLESKTATATITATSTGKPLGSEVMYQSRPYVPQTITKEQRAKVLTQMQERLATAKENVRQAQAQHTPNVRPYYEAQSGVRRASASRDAAQNKFMDDLALRKEAQRILAEKQWAADNLLAQVPQSQRNRTLFGTEWRKYLGNEAGASRADLQKTLDAQLAKAKADVQTMVANETKSRELYYKSEKALVDAEGRFQKASTAYVRSVGHLKKAQSELQSVAKAERSIVDSYRSNASISTVGTIKNDTNLASKEVSAEMAHQAAVLKRFNRRFNKSYATLEQVRRDVNIKNIAVNIKKSLGKVRTGLSKLATGLYHFTAYIAAMQVGLAIGSALRKHLKIDDYFNKETRQKEEQHRQENMQLMRENSFNLIERLKSQGKLTEAEASLAANTVALASSEKALAQYYTSLVNKGKPKGETLSESERYARDMAKLQENFIEKQKAVGSSNLGYTTRQYVEASEAVRGNAKKGIRGIEFDENTVESLRRLMEYQKVAAEERGYAKDVELHGWLPKLKILAARMAGVEDQTYTRSAQEDYTEPFIAKLATINDKLPATLADQLLKIFSDTKLTDEQAADAMRRAITSYTTVRERSGALVAPTISYGEATDIAQKFATQLVPLVDRLINIRKAPKTQAEINAQIKQQKYKNSAEAVGKMQSRISDYYSPKFKDFDFTSTKAYTKRDNLPSGTSLEGVELAETVKHYTRQLNALRTFDADVAKSIGFLTENEASPDYIKRFKQATQGQRSLYSDAIKRTAEKLNKVEKAFVDSVTNSVDKIGDILIAEGLSKDSIGYAEEMQKTLKSEISKLDNLIKNTTDEKLKEVYARLRMSLQQQFTEHRATKYDLRSKDRQLRVSAGMMSESMATRGEISDLQEQQREGRADISSLSSQRSMHAKGTTDYYFYTNRIADAQKKLQDTSIKLRGAFNKLAESSNEARSGLMDTVKEFASTDNRLDIKTLTELGGKWTQGAAGRMTNDALWHSMNLASRMGGMVRSQPYMVKTSLAPNRQRTAQLRDQAQGAISASVDAWIMSQKYAQANVGKTVTDIYSFMKQNNIITVRNK